MTSAATSTSGWWALPLAATLVVLGLCVTGVEPRSVAVLYVAVVTPALCAADVRERRLPNALVLPGYAAALVACVGDWWWSGELPVVALVAGAAFAAGMLVLSVLGGMGMGDVKLAGVLGLASGLVGGGAAILTPLAAFLLGGLAATAAVRAGRGASIPFGPYLLAGFWIALLVSGATSPGASST